MGQIEDIMEDSTHRTLHIATIMDFDSLPKSNLLMWKRTLSWMTSQKIIADVAATSSDVVDTITDVEM